jgi:hypothetical protein
MKNQLNINNGDIENNEYRRCSQVQCSYYLDGGCKPCAECKAETFILNKTCTRCTSCETIPNNLRWDDPNAIKKGIAASQKNELTQEEITRKLMKHAIGQDNNAGKLILIKRD